MSIAVVTRTHGASRTKEMMGEQKLDRHGAGTIQM